MPHRWHLCATITTSLIYGRYVPPTSLDAGDGSEDPKDIPQSQVSNVIESISKVASRLQPVQRRMTQQTMPMVNACKGPGEGQTYDIIYKAPVFNADGIKVSSAYITVLHNNVLIQNHTEIKGTTPFIGLPKNPAHGKGPLMIQDHNNPVSFRNIWVREL